MKTNAKQTQRLRRAKSTRMHIRELQQKNPELVMLTVHKSNNHIYANAVVYDCYSAQTKVIVTASTLEGAIREACNNKTGNIDAAKHVGKTVAQRLLEKLPQVKIAFDRSGYKYHGRVKALAEGAREEGLNF